MIINELEIQGTEEVTVEDESNNDASLGLENETVSEDAIVQNSEADEQVDQKIDGTAQKQEDWTADERYERMWGKDSNGLYKSYINAEGFIEELKPFKDKYNDLSSKFEQSGLKIDELDNFISEYKSLKDPENPRNQDLKILENYLSNPDFEQRIGNFFRELQVEDLQRKFPNMNQSQIEYQMKMEAELKELKQAEEQRKYETIEKKTLDEIKQNTDKVAKFSNDRGFEFTEEIRAGLLDYCYKNDVPAKYMFSIFIEQHGEKLQEALENKMRDKYTGNLKKIEKPNIPSSIKSIKSSQNSSESNRAKLRDTIKSWL